MSFCTYCFCKKGEPHHPKCPVVNRSANSEREGLKSGHYLNNGRFRIGMTLNRGGFGMAYICFDQVYERRIVVKEFFPEKYARRESGNGIRVRYQDIDLGSLHMMQAQFYREYDIMTKAACPGIPAVYGFFEENNTAYIAMDFIDGTTFKSYLQKRNSAPPWWELRRKFFFPLMSIVSIIHRKGILHRDISLVNLMITPKEEIFLLDFGAGRDFHEKDTVEKLRFANKIYAPIEQTHPEQGYKQGPWTDIFAMGTVFYAAITGHYPPTAVERPQKAVESALAYAPNLPEAIDDALMKALFYEPAYRFHSINEFAAALAVCPDPSNGNDRDIRSLVKKVFH